MKFKIKKLAKIKGRFGQKAFTLIELLIVIAIIALLASIVMLAFNRARLSARDSKRNQDVKNLIKGMELYYSDNNTYPRYGSPNTVYDLSTALQGASPPVSSLYVSSVPVDPIPGTSTPYLYIWGNGGNDYGIALLYEGVGSYCDYVTKFGSGWWFSHTPTCTR